jgi:hypothetical protein
MPAGQANVKDVFKAIQSVSSTHTLLGILTDKHIADFVSKKTKKHLLLPFEPIEGGVKVTTPKGPVTAMFAK